jgi:hypothetical protein
LKEKGNQERLKNSTASGVHFGLIPESLKSRIENGGKFMKAKIIKTIVRTWINAPA